MAHDGWMDAEIAQLNERLTSLEAEVAIQAEAAVESASYATKEDISRIEAILVNCASKDDVARSIDVALVPVRTDIARVDAVLDSIQKNYATKADLLHLEVRIQTEMGQMRASIAQMQTQLQTGMAQMQTQLQAGMAQMQAQMQAVTAQMDARLAQMDARLAQADARLAQTDARIAQMETRMVRLMLATFFAVIGVSCSVVLGVVKLLQ